MNKNRLVLMTVIVISITLGTTLGMGLLNAAPAKPARDPTMFVYTVKWICNAPSGVAGPVDPLAAEDIGLVPGEYKTDINVHNGAFSRVHIDKKFVASVHESPNVTGEPKGFASTFLDPDNAFFADCSEITLLLNISPLHAAKGFLVMFADTPMLDVVVEYSSLAFNTTLVPGPVNPFSTTPEGIALDVEHVTPVPLKIPFLECTATPTSLTIPRGSQGASRIVISSQNGFSGTADLSAQIVPRVPGEPTVSFSPTTVILTLGGTATSTLTVSTTPNTPPGSYDVTVIASSGGIFTTVTVTVQVT